MADVRPGFAVAVGFTVWLGGLLVAFMLGMGSAYLAISGIFLASRVRTRIRERRNELISGLRGSPGD